MIRILSSETAVKFIYTSACLHLLLFSGVKRMTLGADVKLKHVALLSGAGHKRRAASANRRNLMIIGMYIFSHYRISSKLLAYAIIILPHGFVNRFRA